MAQFPRLKTAAVAQYPAYRTIGYATRVVRFLDGSEQRFRERSGTARRWWIRLDLLDEAELARIEAFYLGRQGQFAAFDFTDPWDGTVYPECRFEQDALDSVWNGFGNTGAVLTVRQSED